MTKIPVQIGKLVVRTALRDIYLFHEGFEPDGLQFGQESGFGLSTTEICKLKCPVLVRVDYGEISIFGEFQIT